MSTQVIRDPGMGESFQAVAQILQLAGAAEKQRQQRSATEGIVRALASGDEAGMQAALKAAVEFQAGNSGGLGGILQKIGALNMTGASPGMSALTETGLPLMKMQGDIREGAARNKYWSDPSTVLRRLHETRAVYRGTKAAGPGGKQLTSAELDTLLKEDPYHQKLMRGIDKYTDMLTGPDQQPAGPGPGAGGEPGVVSDEEKTRINAQFGSPGQTIIPPAGRTVNPANASGGMVGPGIAQKVMAEAPAAGPQRRVETFNQDTRQPTGTTASGAPLRVRNKVTNETGMTTDPEDIRKILNGELPDWEPIR